MFAPLADSLKSLYLDGNPLDPIPTRVEFEAVLPNMEELELPVMEAVETVVPRVLTAAGGSAPTCNAVLVSLILGIGTIAAAVMVVMAKSARSR